MLRSAETSFGDLKRPSANRAMQRFANVSELSDVIVFLLGPQSTFVTGAVWAVDGGSLA
jgi:NAD(P)-dependent dehydrogenase (short-subunit alcohol dehydrogenase family)